MYLNTHLLALSLALLLLRTLALARKINSPPLATINAHQIPISPVGEHDLDGIDIITGSGFAGLTTFANLPYESCFVDGETEGGYDVAILGAPFDTVSFVEL